MLSCTQVSLGHVSALLSWVSWVSSVLLQGPVGSLRSAAHITTGLDRAMTLFCLLASSSVSILAVFHGLFHLFDILLQKCTLQFLQSLDGSSFSELFLSFCCTFWIAGHSWACSHGTTSLWNVPHWHWTELRNILCLGALLLLRHLGFLCCHYRMMLHYIQLLVPCSSQGRKCSLFGIVICCIALTVINLWCFPGCMFCRRHPSASVVLLSWEAHHAQFQRNLAYCETVKKTEY